MNIWRWSYSTLALLMVALLSGCGGSRESNLIGQWGVSPTFATMGIMKGTESAPSAQAAASAGIMFASMKIDIKEDKTFTYLMMPMTMSGNWTFDEETSLITFNTTKIDLPQADKDKGAKPPSETMTFVGKLDDDNSRITVQMAPTWTEPQGGAAIPNMADLSRGIPFVKP
jgi:hypothetical protein